MNDLTEMLLSDYQRSRAIDAAGPLCRPTPQKVLSLLEQLLKLLFPGYFDASQGCASDRSYFSMLVSQALFQLEELVLPLAQVDCAQLLGQLPAIRETLETDLQAFLSGDPAAASAEEIIVSYPGFYAITVQRLAHLLHCAQVPLLPRMMTELAHSRTGIDIHPGAQLGDAFFIDHGTGVVIGQTAVIGRQVKLYQGVTLGALSTKNAPALRDKKRHPTLEDGVTVYAGATILGGDTVIGRDAVIGANAFVTRSVEPGATVIGHRLDP